MCNFIRGQNVIYKSARPERPAALDITVRVVSYETVCVYVNSFIKFSKRINFISRVSVFYNF